MSPTFLAVIVLIVGGLAVIIGDDWRIRLLALVLQYAAIAAMMAVEVFPALGLIRLIAGAIASIILFQSLRHSSASDISGPSQFLRVISILFASVASLGLAQTYPLSDFPKDVTIGSYWLVFSSIASLVLSRDVSGIGFALLMLEMAAALLAGIMVETANLARFLLASLASIILALAVGALISLDQRTAASSEVES